MGWRELLAAADAQIPGYRRILLDAAEQAGGNINWRTVEHHLKRGQWETAAQVVSNGWAPGAQQFESAIHAQTAQAMDAGASIAAADLNLSQAAFGLGGTFRLVNPSAVLWASTRSSSLIVAITDQQRNAVRDLVRTVVAGGGTTDSVQKHIRQVVGLDPRRASALANFALYTTAHATQTPKGQAAAQRAIDRYRQRLLRSRAEVIARTEVLTSMNQGQQEAWIEAKNRGEIGAGLVKRWIVTPDDRLCPYCAPLHGQQVQVDQPFKTPYGDKMTPPAHPQCRCAQGLVRGKPTVGKGAPAVKTVKPYVPPPSYPRPVLDILA